MPFTAPMLAGAKARRAGRAIELVVPRPPGMDGRYIFACSEIDHICTPTVHDLLLCEHIGTSSSLTPREIRRAAHEVACHGAAGRRARAAAAAAAIADRQQEERTGMALLQMLVAQTGGGVCAPAELEPRADIAIHALSARLCRSVAAITADIEALTRLFADLGVDGDPGTARCRRLADAVDRIGGEVIAWGGRLDFAFAHAARQIAAAAADATCAGRLIADAQAKAANLPALLASWARDQDRVAAELRRAEWLLDGWETICLIWDQAADDGARKAAVSEILLTLPLLPREVNDWPGVTRCVRVRRTIDVLPGLGDEWRAASNLPALIARNEQLRALAA